MEKSFLIPIRSPVSIILEESLRVWVSLQQQTNHGCHGVQGGLGQAGVTHHVQQTRR